MSATAALGTRGQYAPPTFAWPDERSSDPGNWDGAQELTRMPPFSKMREGMAHGAGIVRPDSPRMLSELRNVRLSRRESVLSPIVERPSEDTNPASRPRFVEDSPLRSIQVALRTTPECTSQNASPQQSSLLPSRAFEQEAVPVEQQSAESSCYDGAGHQYNYSCPDLTAPTPVARRRWPIYDLLDDNILLNNPPPSVVEHPLEDMIAVPERAHNSTDNGPSLRRAAASAGIRDTQGDGAGEVTAREDDAWVDIQLEAWPLSQNDNLSGDGTWLPIRLPMPHPIGIGRREVDQTGELVDIS